jgi:hypothetical protein
MAIGAYKRFTLLTSIVCLIGLAQSSNNWAVLKYWKIAGNESYVDLRSVLQATDCYNKEGFAIYSHELGNPCTYNYGSLLIRILDFLHLGSDSTEVLGVVFIAFVSIAIGSIELISNRKSFLGYLFIGFLAFSPPVLLLMERGNIDTLIVILLISSVFFTLRKQYVLSTLLILLMTLIKFYPIVLFFDLLVRIKTFKYRIFLMCITLLAAAQILYDQSRGPGFISIFWASFGASVWGIYLGYLGLNVPYKLSLFLGILLFIFSVFVVRELLKKLVTNKPEHLVFKHNSARIFFIYVTIIHLFCFVAGMNFDYRLVFLLLGNLTLIYSTNLPKSIITLIGVALMCSLWLSFNLHELQPLGDFFILFLSAVDALLLCNVFYIDFSGKKLFKR